MDVEISFSAKTRLEVHAFSLVFVLKLISTFIGQNFFFHVWVEEGRFASWHIAQESKT